MTLGWAIPCSDQLSFFYIASDEKASLAYLYCSSEPWLLLASDDIDYAIKDLSRVCHLRPSRKGYKNFETPHLDILRIDCIDTDYTDAHLRISGRCGAA